MKSMFNNFKRTRNLDFNIFNVINLSILWDHFFRNKVEKTKAGQNKEDIFESYKEKPSESK